MTVSVYELHRLFLKSPKSWHKILRHNLFSQMPHIWPRASFLSREQSMQPFTPQNTVVFSYSEKLCFTMIASDNCFRASANDIPENPSRGRCAALFRYCTWEMFLRLSSASLECEKAGFSALLDWQAHL